MQSTTPSNQRNTVRMAKLEVKLSCWKHWNRTILNHKLLLRQKLMTGKSNMSYALALSETWALSLCVMLVNMFVLLLRKQVFFPWEGLWCKICWSIHVRDWLFKQTFARRGQASDILVVNNSQGQASDILVVAGDKSEVIEWYISKS